MANGRPTARDILLPDLVWQKAREVAGQYPGEIRVDDFNNLIARSQYGTRGPMGWEIDHIRPTALGGTDDLPNLRPLHWQANRSGGGILGALLR